MFKGSHTDTVLENDLLQTAKSGDECQIRKLAEGLNSRIQPTYNLNSRSEEDIFKYVFCMRSFEPLCGRRKIVFKDSIFACKYMNILFLLIS